MWVTDMSANIYWYWFDNQHRGPGCILRMLAAQIFDKQSTTEAITQSNNTNWKLCNIPMIRICEIDIGNPKYTIFTKLVQVRNFYLPFWV